MKKNMLICGATGFIGRNALAYFSKSNKYNIKATYFTKPKIDNYNNTEWIRCDLRDYEQVNDVAKDIDILLQFAATTSGSKDILSKPYIHVTDNALMNSLLLRAAFENKIKHFVFPSCSIMYQSKDTALKESDFNPNDEINSIYFGAGYTKVYLEKMCEFYSRFGHTKHTVLRQSNIYGPYDKYDLEKSHVFAASVNKVVNSKDENVVIWGSGNEKRDLLFVDDLIELINLSIERQDSQFEIFNAGYGQAVSINELVDKIVFHNNEFRKITNDLSKKSIPTSLFLDCTKAHDILDWKPTHTLDEGIIKTLKWYKQEYQS